MNTILVDTTIWVEFFREKERTKQADVLQQLIEADNNICICPIIYQEVLQGVRDDKAFTEIKSILQNVMMTSTPIMIVADHAIDLYRSLRKKGITIRKPYDCLIASYAILEDIYLLHNDSDFSQMKNNSTLKVYSWRGFNTPPLWGGYKGIKPETKYLVRTTIPRPLCGGVRHSY